MQAEVAWLFRQTDQSVRDTGSSQMPLEFACGCRVNAPAGHSSTQMLQSAPRHVFACKRGEGASGAVVITELKRMRGP